jgi:hypothetical protein
MKQSLRNAIAFYTICSTIAVGIIGIAFKAREASRAISLEENPTAAPQDPTCTPEARAADEETFFVNCGGFY